jgi:hypothetical protein
MSDSQILSILPLQRFKFEGLGFGV